VPRDPDPPPAPAASEPTGLAVHPPLGSKPIQRGIIVPEGFELPPGYVRHQQATDDGRLLPGVLKFHPDYVPRDAAGNPIPIPEDRIVPPELAPPGLPVRFPDMDEPVDPAPEPPPER
jgi:hypothetical protein